MSWFLWRPFWLGSHWIQWDMDSSLTLLIFPVVEADEEDMKKLLCFVENHRTLLHRYVAFRIWTLATWNSPTCQVRDDIIVYRQQQLLPQPSFAEITVYLAVESGQRKTRANDDIIIQELGGKVKDDQFVGQEQKAHLMNIEGPPKSI